jgi:hypothetical protein
VLGGVQNRAQNRPHEQKSEGVHQANHSHEHYRGQKLH